MCKSRTSTLILKVRLSALCLSWRLSFCQFVSDTWDGPIVLVSGVTLATQVIA